MRATSITFLRRPYLSGLQRDSGGVGDLALWQQSTVDCVSDGGPQERIGFASQLRQAVE